MIVGAPRELDFAAFAQNALMEAYNSDLFDDRVVAGYQNTDYLIRLGFGGRAALMTFTGALPGQRSEWFGANNLADIPEGGTVVINSDQFAADGSVSGGRDRSALTYRREGPKLVLIGNDPFRQQSSWVAFRDDVAPLVQGVLALGGGAWLGPQIGAALLGPAASTYPAVASSVGNVVVRTALNGGDLGAAVQSALIGQVGNIANVQIVGLTDSQLLGNVSAAALRASLAGGDAQQAVQNVLISAGLREVPGVLEIVADNVTSAVQTGVNAMDDFFSYADPVDTSVAEYAFGGEIVAGFADPIGDVSDFYTGFDMTNSLDVSAGGGVGFNFGSFEDAFIAAEDYSDADFNYTGETMDSSGIMPIDFNIFTDTPNLPPLNPTEQAGSAGSDGSWVVDLTNLALAAIRVNQAYQATQQQAPRTVTQGAGGVTTTGNRNGTVTVRNPSTGATQVTRPGVGIPYVLSDGSTIINNGNGTFSTIRRDGTTTTTAYTAASANGSAGDSAQWIDGVPNAALLAGGAVLAFLALKGR